MKSSIIIAPWCWHQPIGIYLRYHAGYFPIQRMILTSFKPRHDGNCRLAYEWRRFAVSKHHLLCGRAWQLLNYKANIDVQVHCQSCLCIMRRYVPLGGANRIVGTISKLHHYIPSWHHSRDIVQALWSPIRNGWCFAERKQKTRTGNLHNKSPVNDRFWTVNETVLGRTQFSIRGASQVHWQCCWWWWEWW